MNPPEKSVSELIAELEARGMTKEEIGAHLDDGQTTAPHDVESSESGEKPAYAERDEAALADKGALKPCEACGEEFKALGLRAFVQTLEDDTDTYRRGKGTAGAIALCVNCGLMRLHYLGLLHVDEDEGDAAG